MFLFPDDGIFFAVINQGVIDVVKVNIIAVHVRKTKKEWGVYGHDFEVDYAERRFYADRAQEGYFVVISEFDLVFASRKGVDGELWESFLQG
jgi:hypothetical protein